MSRDDNVLSHLLHKILHLLTSFNSMMSLGYNNLIDIKALCSMSNHLQVDHTHKYVSINLRNSTTEITVILICINLKCASLQLFST